MMNRFIKIKQESSDWLSNCQTQAEKDRYIDRFLERENITLDFSKVIDNPGLRSLANLILNSFWGKFGQRENQPKTSIVNQSAEFFRMMSNPTIYVNTVLPVNEDTLIVNWEYREEACDSLPTVNVVIAAFVTAQARLKLYGYLEQLEKRVLYYDTDSVIYVSRPGEFAIPTGEFVGDMTDELEKEGLDSYITEFVTGGPKNYSYTLWSTKNREHKTVCKVKGISLNHSASQLINFDVIKDMVLTPCDPIFIVNKQIRRTQEHEVVTLKMRNWALHSAEEECDWSDDAELDGEEECDWSVDVELDSEEECAWSDDELDSEECAWSDTLHNEAPVLIWRNGHWERVLISIPPQIVTPPPSQSQTPLDSGEDECAWSDDDISHNIF
ncbi:hypothetical protein JTB14_013361 [Gonioctena quinquepunctata]|nr:hypothetical protein JTB14_013361 [Gonioctena quinquepunctata]